MTSTVNIGEAQVRLPALVKQDSFTICRRGKPVGVFLSAERLAALAESLELVAALAESLELLVNPEFQSAVRRLERGETPVTLAQAESLWNRATSRADRKPRRRIPRQRAA